MKRLVSPIITAVAASTLSFNALSAEIKNVILMIGDGMGPQQVGLLETYANHAPNSIYKGQTTALYKLAQEGVIGSSLTNPEDAIVVDSACSATMLATGIPTASEVIGIDSQGNHVETILEKAKSKGKATGACFRYAHDSCNTSRVCCASASSLARKQHRFRYARKRCRRVVIWWSSSLDSKID